MLAELPDHILQLIIQSLFAEDAISVFTSCKRMRGLEHDDIWKRYCLSVFMRSRYQHPLPPNTTWKRHFIQKYCRPRPSTYKSIPHLLFPKLYSSGQLQSIKCVVVGSGRVGKSSLIFRFCEGYLPEYVLPPVVDNQVKEMGSVGSPPALMLSLWDTCGESDYGRLRPLSYPPTDVFIISFSLTDILSYWDVTETWFPELRHHCPNVPFILVGTKMDLRNTNNWKQCVTKAQGIALALSVGAATYVECSACNESSTTFVFEQAVAAVFPRRKQQRCDLQ